MSDYDESFEEFVEEDVASTSRSRSPRREPSPRKVIETVYESSYENESFEAPSPAKAHTIAFGVGAAVQVYWKDDDAWFQGIVRRYDPHQGYYIQYEDGDEQWEDAQWIRESTAAPAGKPRSPSPEPRNVPTCPTNPPPAPVLNRVVLPRPYKAVADHYTTEKIARPYQAVAVHPAGSSMFLIPRRFTTAMESCASCRARSAHGYFDCDTVLLMPQASAPSVETPCIYGDRPSEHRFLKPQQGRPPTTPILTIPMNVAPPSSPAKASASKSPVPKRPRVNTAGFDGVDRQDDDEEEEPTGSSGNDVIPESPSKKPHTSPRKVATEVASTGPAFGGFSAFANTNPFQAVTANKTTGFAAFASGGFGTKALSTGFGGGFGSGFGSSFASSGFGTTFSKPTTSSEDDAEDKESPPVSSWTEANENNAEFLNTEADKVEIQNLVIPKVDLPKDYHHSTGEENEDVLIHLTAKLYKLVDKEYIECGAGPLKVLQPKDKSSRGRIVMRRATSDFKAGTQLLLNARLSSVPNVLPKGKSLIVTVLVDASTVTTFAIRLDSVENAEKLQQLIQQVD
ncbi:hypothetical protein Ae201684P_000656 [Aphanomyces euteiches]|nr:hypothetical protein Ae201684P_000656 [Aphanomyces euteiches]KAH9154734.1 hypothetical protein AeRB84_003216 [Aphanomyces euteiches]